MLKADYASMEAEQRFPVEHIGTSEATEYRSGQVLQSALKPINVLHYSAQAWPADPVILNVVLLAATQGGSNGLHFESAFNVAPLRCAKKTPK